MARRPTMMEKRAELELAAAKAKAKRAEERAATAAKIAATVDETNAQIAEIEQPTTAKGRKVAARPSADNASP